jgi:rubrerythrin
MVLQIGVLMLSFLFMGQVQAQEAQQMNMEILKEKVKADKKLVVANNMKLTDAESKKFWPLYDAYQMDLNQINERMMSMIKSYADAYNAGKGELSNDQAKKLIGEALAVEESEVKLRQTYAAKLNKVLPATKVARYLQIENKIRAIVKFELAARIPLVN